MRNSLIQWCDDTVNAVMGCHGCELWPSWAKLLRHTLQVLALYLTVTADVCRRVKFLADDYSDSTYRLFIKAVVLEFVDGKNNQREAIKRIRELLKCYAGCCTENRAGRKGYPVNFNIPTMFPGRLTIAASAGDLSGTVRPDKPWLDGLPRLIFISDMGDALSANISFEDLLRELIEPVRSTKGSRHIWLWLTKRPARMAQFAAWLKRHNMSWPDNLVPMTTITSQKTVFRIAQILKVPAKVHALSVEPLFEPVTLPLNGIDWVIVGGESGPSAGPFHLEWARSIQNQCKATGVAFFLKQLGARPFLKDRPLALNDSHGGAWDEWPVAFRVRELPKGFRSQVDAPHILHEKQPSPRFLRTLIEGREIGQKQSSDSRMKLSRDFFERNLPDQAPATDAKTDDFKM